MSDLEWEEYAAMGLRSIFSAVSFLSNDCHIVHGAVFASAVLVTDEFDWKLGLLDNATEHATVSDPSAPLRDSSLALPPALRAPEASRADWAAVAASPPHALDAWGLGCLVQEVLSSSPVDGPQALRSVAHIPASLRPCYMSLMQADPRKRSNPKDALGDCSFLQSSTALAVAFLEECAIKDPREKARFFEELPSMLGESVIGLG